MNNRIEHLGIVKNIQGRHIAVQIVQTSACSTCVAAGHCNASERKVKIIDVYDADSSLYQIGQQVRLWGSTSMGMKAVMWAFGMPFVVLVAVLGVLRLMMGCSEPMAAAGAFAALVVYYAILYLLRDRMSQKFTFTIEPIK